MSEERENPCHRSPAGPGLREPTGAWRAAMHGGAIGALLLFIPMLFSVVCNLAAGQAIIGAGPLRDLPLPALLSGACWVAIICGPFCIAIGALFGLERRRNLMRYAEELRARKTAAWSKPGPFSAVPERPFEHRLRNFTGHPSDGSRQPKPADEPRQSKMPFYLAAPLGRPFRPKSAAYIRQILNRIRLALRGSLE